jgi:hypothetical protein
MDIHRSVSQFKIDSTTKYFTSKECHFSGMWRFRLDLELHRYRDHVWGPHFTI